MTPDFTKLKSELTAVIDKWAAASAPSAPVPPPPPAPAAGYTVKAGRIYDAAGMRVPIRGISHYGFNDPDLLPEFLWVQQWTEQLAQIKALGFNAIRCPYVPDTLYDQRKLGSPGLSWLKPEPKPGPDNDMLMGKTPLQALDLWMFECDRLGLYVLLDFHSVSMIRQIPQWFANTTDQALVYNKQPYGKEDWIRDLVFVAKRYATFPHFLGLDLYNEPNGRVRWSSGDANMVNPAYWWKPAAEDAAAAVLKANPNLLVFVQGSVANWDGIENTELSKSCNWGENLQAQKYKPLAIPAGKLVLTPHTYGPYPGRMKPSFSDPTFPKNLGPDWMTMFGSNYPKNAVCIGEWGGRYEGQDRVWQDALVTWMLDTGMTDSFFWCLVNSKDTGALLDDKGDVIPEKMALVRRSWGN